MATSGPHVKNGNGKRERNPMEAEDSEFTPLSKRINNLHLYQSSGNSRKSSHPHQAFDLNQSEVTIDSNSRPNYPGTSSDELRSCPRNNDVGTGHGYSSHYQSSHGGERDDLLKNYGKHNNSVIAHVNGITQEMQKYCDIYNPSLDSASNPHYYESNRQLYLLYLERMQRTGQILHPQFYSTNL